MTEISLNLPVAPKTRSTVHGRKLHLMFENDTRPDTARENKRTPLRVAVLRECQQAPNRRLTMPSCVIHNCLT